MWIACVDVGYSDSQARAACVVIRDWTDPAPAEEHVAIVDGVEDYQPGEFFRRELPCIQAVLGKIDHDIDCIVIDGYVWLDANGRPGLGAYLYESCDSQIPIVGVAKNSFKDHEHSVELLRGESQRPLYVTAAGLPLSEAVDNVQKMHGNHRVPTVLRRVDQLSRGELPS